MSDFLQIHALAAYPPSNMNRDETGRPKTAVFGGAPRLRISSQSLKRAWRTGPVFRSRLAANLGTRTRQIGDLVVEHLSKRNVDEKRSVTIAKALVEQIAKLDGKAKGPADTGQLVFLGTGEIEALLTAADAMASGEAKAADTASMLRTADSAVDVAMFGRMLADKPEFSREAAVQVAHAITTHKVVVEDDYFTAVDDLQKASDDQGAGAAHIGVVEFGAGVFYLYLCVDRKLLRDNLNGDAALAADAIDALIESVATVAPKGKRSTFAHQGRAFYVLAESGDQQPRSLAAAFLRPVEGNDQGANSVQALLAFRDRIDQAYGVAASGSCEMNVLTGEGTLADVMAFARG